ncbi:MAG: hypothetical protein Q8L85_03725 [Alphaproteobacteria bacterium]|nr:hypothetical protein [Alphaproteobacteria bacterium]
MKCFGNLVVKITFFSFLCFGVTLSHVNAITFENYDAFIDYGTHPGGFELRHSDVVFRNLLHQLMEIVSDPNETSKNRNIARYEIARLCAKYLYNPAQNLSWYTFVKRILALEFNFEQMENTEDNTRLIRNYQSVRENLKRFSTAVVNKYTHFIHNKIPFRLGREFYNTSLEPFPVGQRLENFNHCYVFLTTNHQDLPLVKQHQLKIGMANLFLNHADVITDIGQKRNIVQEILPQLIAIIEYRDENQNNEINRLKAHAAILYGWYCYRFIGIIDDEGTNRNELYQNALNFLDRIAEERYTKKSLLVKANIILSSNFSALPNEYGAHIDPIRGDDIDARNNSKIEILENLLEKLREIGEIGRPLIQVIEGVRQELTQPRQLQAIPIVNGQQEQEEVLLEGEDIAGQQPQLEDNFKTMGTITAMCNTHAGQAEILETIGLVENCLRDIRAQQQPVQADQAPEMDEDHGGDDEGGTWDSDEDHDRRDKYVSDDEDSDDGSDGDRIAAAWSDSDEDHSVFADNPEDSRIDLDYFKKIGFSDKITKILEQKYENLNSLNVEIKNVKNQKEYTYNKIVQNYKVRMINYFCQYGLGDASNLTGHRAIFEAYGDSLDMDRESIGAVMRKLNIQTKKIFTINNKNIVEYVLIPLLSLRGKFIKGHISMIANHIPSGLCEGNSLHYVSGFKNNKLRNGVSEEIKKQLVQLYCDCLTKNSFDNLADDLEKLNVTMKAAYNILNDTLKEDQLPKCPEYLKILSTSERDKQIFEAYTKWIKDNQQLTIVDFTNSHKSEFNNCSYSIIYEALKKNGLTIRDKQAKHISPNRAEEIRKIAYKLRAKSPGCSDRKLAKKIRSTMEDDIGMFVILNVIAKRTFTKEKVTKQKKYTYQNEIIKCYTELSDTDKKLRCLSATQERLESQGIVLTHHHIKKAINNYRKSIGFKPPEPEHQSDKSTRKRKMEDLESPHPKKRVVSIERSDLLSKSLDQAKDQKESTQQSVSEFCVKAVPSESKRKPRIIVASDSDDES